MLGNKMFTADVVSTADFKKMVDAMHSTDETKRRAVYLALAYIIALHILRKYESQVLSMDNEVKLNEVLANLAEVAILDRALLISLVKGHFKLFTLSADERLSMVSGSECMCSLMGVANVYSKGDLEYIQANYPWFKSILLITNHAISTVLQANL